MCVSARNDAGGRGSPGRRLDSSSGVIRSLKPHYRSCSVASANRSNVLMPGIRWPLSRRAMADCVVLMRWASCSCVRPARPAQDCSWFGVAPQERGHSAPQRFAKAGGLSPCRPLTFGSAWPIWPHIYEFLVHGIAIRLSRLQHRLAIFFDPGIEHD
jgi:hypothetical protein